MTESELLDIINNADNIEADTGVVAGCIHTEPAPLPEDPNAGQEWKAADNEKVIFEDNEFVPRMPINIECRGKRTTIYQDVHDGGVYTSEDGGEMLSDAIQEALAVRDGAFSGNGIDNGDERSVVEFVLGMAAGDDRFMRRSEILKEQEDQDDY